MRTKEEQAGPDATSTPGCTSQTGNSIWTRSLKNQPCNEEAIRQTPLRGDCEVYKSPVRGLTFTREEMEHEHRANLAAIPYEIFERVMVRHGAILTDEVA